MNDNFAPNIIDPMIQPPFPQKSRFEQLLDKYAQLKLEDCRKQGVEGSKMPIDLDSAQIKELAFYAYECDKIIDRLESHVEVARSNRFHVLLQLGRRMFEQGIDDFTLADEQGNKQARFMKDLEVFASIEDMNKAKAFFESHQLGALVKTVINLPKDDEDITKVCSTLREAGLGEFIGSTIHPSTLVAEIKKLLKESESIPPVEISGIKMTEQKRSKITKKY